MEKLAASFGAPREGVSWYVTYTFRRPVSWKKLELSLKEALATIANGTAEGRTSWTFTDAFELELYPTSKPYPTLFVMGGSMDDDAGGWLMSKMEENLKFCIAEKTAKIAPVKEKYPTWWLVLVDHIGYGLRGLDREIFHDQVSLSHSWDKLILLDPKDPKEAFEI